SIFSLTFLVRILVTLMDLSFLSLLRHTTSGTVKLYSKHFSCLVSIHEQGKSLRRVLYLVMSSEDHQMFWVLKYEEMI
ncbi:hypothetical protein ACQP3J_33060, partial [Escherichia coli]